ncbi:UDP-glucose 4-epimerase GalE [Brevibacillus fluminis]|uniref:UDP-glucose 4-epimerase GalE n=1 Tax=Brevibacillus fluminis TaxID=511487 RepID=UPI003F8C2BD0
MAILVTGGAGYIGSHTVAELVAGGEDVIVLDNLTTGHSQAVSTPFFYEGDIQDSALLDRIFTEHAIEAVIHFAASSLVGESIIDPLGYYDNNLLGAHMLLKKMRQHGVSNLVFSSTAAVYGEPANIPIEESDPTVPTNPYGETKLAIEKMIEWCSRAYGMNAVSLRYFNAAGAHPDGTLGEDHVPESHLIPIVLEAALGKREYVAIYGNDYPTADGTCIRDFIHVMDLASAHYLALQRLRESREGGIFNLGNGTGYSVKQVIELAREITGHPIPARIMGRRSGDPAILVASSELAKAELGWRPQYDDIGTIIQSAWNWHRQHPHGYQGSGHVQRAQKR